MSLSSMETSFEEGSEGIDVQGVLVEMTGEDQESQDAMEQQEDQIIINKKLSEVFDTLATKGASDGSQMMKVYLRVRPVSSKAETTITIESDTSIVTNAPDSSKRAQYTKTEERHYVSTKKES